MPRAIRVVHLCDYASPYPGSFIPMLSAAQAGVAARGGSFEAVFAAGTQDRDWYEALARGGMRVRASPPLPRRAKPRWVAKLAAERTGQLILHTHFAGWDLAAVLAARLSRRPDPAAVIWHRHGVLGARPWLRLRDLARFGLVGHAVDAHLCVGPGTQAQQLALRTPRRRTLLFPNPVDVGRFPPVTAEERARARAELGIQPNVDLLVGFTWEWDLKGGPLLVAVVRELEHRGRNVTAIAVGGGARARDDARRLGVEGRVRDVAPRDDPRPFFAAADVFLSPSSAEAFGFAPHEAVCCGTPVVASDLPGHRHYGAHLPAMRLTQLDVGEMADAVEAELAADAGDRAARVATSRAYLERHAGVDAWVDRLLHIYEDVLDRHAFDASCS